MADAIVISDDDDVIRVPNRYNRSPNKTPKRQVLGPTIVISSDSDSDVETTNVPTRIPLKRSASPLEMFVFKRRRVSNSPPIQTKIEPDSDGYTMPIPEVETTLGKPTRNEVYIERYRRPALLEQKCWMQKTESNAFFKMIHYLHPFTQSRPTLYHRQRRIGLALSLNNLRNPRFTDQNNSQRLGGCPNTIAQGGGCVVITSNTHGVNSGSIAAPPDNWNGLTAFSATNGSRISFMNAGHAVRRRTGGSHSYYGEPIDGPIYEQEYIFQNVLDAQFDPARSDTFLTVGSDNKMFVWTIEEGDDKSLRIRSRINGENDQENCKETFSQPHYIQFNPSQRHWTREEDNLSTYAVTEGNAKVNVEFSTSDSCVLRVDNDKDQEVSSMCWGTGPTEDILFAGTESKNSSDNYRAIGKQAGFRINPHGSIPFIYTESQEETQCIALDPRGELLASFTRTCDISNGTSCSRCDTRKIYSTHKLSLYSAGAHSGRATRKQNPNLLAEVVLPNFKPSDRIGEAGIVVQASWSPCGTYIGCGTDDDQIHIYDHRFIHGAPLLTFAHTGSHEPIRKRRATTFLNENSECCWVKEKRPEYGVTGLSWLSNRFEGRGLASGGSDGCVRLWDVRQGQPEPITLAEMETSISCFSFGDPSRGDVPLVVADNHGLVKMFGTR